jgi:hypothetical protein
MRRTQRRSSWDTSSGGWNWSDVGRLLIVLGLVIAAVGLLVSLGVPIGRLPGDFSVRRGSVSFYFPLTTSILASVILTLVMMFLGRR